MLSAKRSPTPTTTPTVDHVQNIQIPPDDDQSSTEAKHQSDHSSASQSQFGFRVNRIVIEVIHRGKNCLAVVVCAVSLSSERSSRDSNLVYNILKLRIKTPRASSPRWEVSANLPLVYIYLIVIKRVLSFFLWCFCWLPARSVSLIKPVDIGLVCVAVVVVERPSMSA